VAVQDDRRENELRNLFKLRAPENATRGGTDAVLDLDEQEVPFELKSSTDESVTTVRDFGPDHIKKWDGKHWLFGFYDRKGMKLLHCHYASPRQIAPWIEKMNDYILPDFQMAELVSGELTLDHLYRLLGKKGRYSLEDARKLQKKQYNTKRYFELMDQSEGYSPERMLKILQERCGYLIQRGSTLNNPHIPGSFFSGWEKITVDHASRLRELVAQAFRSKA
jgi:hypothetical protein